MLKAIRGIPLFILFLIFISPSYGQENDSLYYFSGQIIRKGNNYPIALAHIINIDRHRGVVADTLGYFNIWIRPGDTLNISALGFDYFDYGINGFIKDSLVTIELQARSYEIPEASISYLGTYKQFEYKVVNLELPDIGINDQFEKIFKHVEPPPLVVAPRVTSPVSLIYSLFSKDANDIKKYLKLEEEGKVKDKVYKRYNEHIIRNITGFDREEAFKFMKFCNFQDKYILSIDDYNLYSEIYFRLEAYKKSKEDSTKTE